MAESNETAKVMSEIEQTLSITLELLSHNKTTSGITRQISSEAKAQIAEVHLRRYDEDLEIAKNIYALRKFSREGGMSFKAICDRLGLQRNECNRRAENHARFIVLPPVCQQALRATRKKATEEIAKKLEVITAKAAAEGKEPDLAYVSHELRAMCGHACKQNDDAQSRGLKTLLNEVDALEKFMKKREKVHDAVETLLSKVGEYGEIESALLDGDI